MIRSGVARAAISVHARYAAEGAYIGVARIRGSARIAGFFGASAQAVSGCFWKLLQLKNRLDKLGTATWPSLIFAMDTRQVNLVRLFRLSRIKINSPNPVIAVVGGVIELTPNVEPVE